MECQPQNPEFRINPENFQPCGVHTLDQLNLKSVPVPDEFHQDGYKLNLGILINTWVKVKIFIFFCPAV